MTSLLEPLDGGPDSDFSLAAEEIRGVVWFDSLSFIVGIAGSLSRGRVEESGISELSISSKYTCVLLFPGRVFGCLGRRLLSFAGFPRGGVDVDVFLQAEVFAWTGFLPPEDGGGETDAEGEVTGVGEDVVKFLV